MSRTIKNEWSTHWRPLDGRLTILWPMPLMTMIIIIDRSPVRATETARCTTNSRLCSAQRSLRVRSLTFERTPRLRRRRRCRRPTTTGECCGKWTGRLIWQRCAPGRWNHCYQFSSLQDLALSAQFTFFLFLFAFSRFESSRLTFNTILEHYFSNYYF